MPDCFATAVWVNPAAMRQCRTFFRQTRHAVASPGPRSMARIFCDFAKRVPDIMDCRDDKGRFICKQYFPEHQHILAQ